MNVERQQDEMNLIEFLRTLWQQKLIILLTIVLCLGFGISYILLSKPVYEATGYLSPPRPGDISYVNQGRSEIDNSFLSTYKPQEIYEMFGKVLQADSTKRSYFNTVFLPSEQDKKSTYSDATLAADFFNSLAIKEIRPLTLVDRSQPADYVVSFRGTSPEQDAEVVKGYISFAKEKAVDDFWLDLNQQRDRKLDDLQAKINTIREIANNQRLDRIEQLREAVKVAQVVAVNHAASNGLITDASVVNNPSMMYLRGTKALQAEIDNLSNRQSSDAFVDQGMKLRETQSLYDLYKNIVFNKSDIRMFRMDSEVRVPDIRIAPRKKFILMLSLLAGIFLGFGLAIIRKPLALIVR